MKKQAVSGAALAAAALSLVLAGSPAIAKHKAQRAPKATAEKHNCGGKNGCPAKAEEKPAAPAAAGDKPADAK
jgi:hypothetical protein